MRIYPFMYVQGYLENCLTTLFKSMETLSANIASKSSENLSRKRRRMAVNRISSHTISAASANLGKLQFL